MSKKNLTILIVVIALAIVVVILSISLVSATDADKAATPSPSASASASATATAANTPSATATTTAKPSGDPIVHIVSAVMTSDTGSGGAPVDSVSQYSPEDPFIASCEIDTDDADPVEFVWYKDGDSFDDDTVTAENGYANCELQSEHTWDPGDYSVEIYLQDSKSPDATLNFSVAVPSPTPPASASASASAS